MNQVEQWTLVKKYRNLVNDGRAASIKCPVCQNEVIFMSDLKTDDPILYCFMEDSHFKPGLYVWDQIKAVVSEHYVE